MFILTLITVAGVIALGYFAYRYSDSLVELARLEAIIEEKEAINSALRAHLSRLEQEVGESSATITLLTSELKVCSDKAAKAKKAAKANPVLSAKPVVTSKRSYNRKSK